MEVGLRVVRGKDWKWGDQDGGEGSVGTVVEVGGQGGKIPKNTVVVVWDTGSKANYRAGHQGADDLKVLDNAVAGARHPSVTCDVCKESGLIGTRWKCEVCHDFDLCHACYMGDKHDLSHAFTRRNTAMSLGVPVPARSASRKVQAKGIYLGATVVRGNNWNYKNQDGGPDKQGLVQSIGGSSEGSSWRSWVKVKWDSGGANDYHRGHDGKVDVKCVKAAAGETYYVDHLACLADYAGSVFCSGDRVKLNESQMLDAHKDQLSEGKADIDVNVRGSYTPLQLAVDRGCYSMIEFLVSKGANLNAKDRNGDTALHLAARSLRQATSFATFTLFEYAKKLKDLDDAPAIAKIYSELPSSVQKHGEWIAICCFLLQNGAQMDIQNDNGKSPENMIGDSKIRQILKMYTRTPVQVSQTQTPIHAQSSRPVGVPSTPIGPKCLMCLTADSDMTFYPCGHKVTCNQCSAGTKTCFSCNEKIQEKVRSPGTLSPPSPSPPSPSPPSPSPKCMMCLTADPDMTFYPCGHKVTCSQCSGGMKTCFSCNERIQEKVRSPATDPADPAIRRSQELTSNNKSSPETLRRSKMTTDPFNCPLCNSRIRNVVFLCGHSCCKECSEPLTSCHVCAQFISRKLTLM